MSQERWDIAVYGGRQGYPSQDYPPCAGKTGQKPERSSKWKRCAPKSWFSETTLQNQFRLTQLPADPFFRYFQLIFDVFARLNVPLWLNWTYDVLFNPLDWILLRQSVPREMGHCCVWRQTGVPYSTTPPVQANRVKNKSGPENEKDPRQKVGFVKLPSKISFGWRSCRQTRFSDIFSWFLMFLHVYTYRYGLIGPMICCSILWTG